MAGIPASFEAVGWQPKGLPEDPDEIAVAILDPLKRGERYPLYHPLRRVAHVHNQSMRA